MGGTPGGGDPGTGGAGASGIPDTGLLSMLQSGFNNSGLGVGMAKLANQYPQISGALGYQGHQGPQLPVGVSDLTLTPQQQAQAASQAATKRQSGFDDITKYGMGMMQPKMGETPKLQLPPAYRPQVNLPPPSLGAAAPSPIQDPSMGGPVFFPIFRR